MFSFKSAVEIEVSESVALFDVVVPFGSNVVVEAINFAIGYPSNARLEYSEDGVTWTDVGQLMPGNSAISFTPISGGRVIGRITNGSSEDFTIPRAASFRISTTQ